MLQAAMQILGIFDISRSCFFRQKDIFVFSKKNSKIHVTTGSSHFLAQGL